MKLPGNWGGWLSSRWDAARSSYWFIPSAMALGAALSAFGMLEVDRAAKPDWVLGLPWISEAGGDGVRATLSVVAGSMITVTGVVFSITIVALTLASSQFGPRLLRNFMRDQGNQLVLGTFLATFLFSLLVLRAVSGAGKDAFVPHLSTTVAVVLGITSLFVLIYFIHHAASSIQASSIVAAVAREIDRALDSLFPEGIGHDPPSGQHVAPEDVASLDERRTFVRAEASGYLRVLDGEALLALARREDRVIGVECRPGEFVAEGSILAWVVPSELSEQATCQLRECFVLGDQRTQVQDLGFLTGQLVEMAVRALSPGVNDPGTAIACVHRLGNALAKLAARPLPGPIRLDADGVVRLVTNPRSFAELARDVIGPVRRYGAGDADVALALLQVLAGAAERARDAKRLAALAELADEVRESSLSKLTVGGERRQVEAAFEDLGESLAGRRRELERFAGSV